MRPEDFQGRQGAKCACQSSCICRWEASDSQPSGAPSFHRRCRFDDGVSNTHIGSAAAEVAAERLLYVFYCGVAMSLVVGSTGHDKSRGAEAELLRIVFNKRRGNRMQLYLGCEYFYGEDVREEFL